MSTEKKMTSSVGRPPNVPRSRTMEDVAEYISKMRFKKKLFGGVDEADVWRQIEELHREYEAVFLAREIRREQGEARAGDEDSPPARESRSAPGGQREEREAGP